MYVEFIKYKFWRNNFEEKNLDKWNMNEYYKRVSAVLEGNRNTYWYATGYENIKYFGYLKGLTLKEINEKSEIFLKKFDLYEDRNKKVSNYSRGMQQKLAIIISLINNPDVLFLDEPTLGLDVESKQKMIEILEEISVLEIIRKIKETNLQFVSLKQKGVKI